MAEKYSSDVALDNITRNVQEFVDILGLDIDSNKNKMEEHLEVDLKYNRIVYGAPGTGKSHKLKKELENVPIEYKERVTFHPSYSYAQFVGSFKPISEETQAGSEIKYRYVLGPFMRVLLEALSNKDEKYYLIIEEINRANVAAVFGDVFQLLDRDDKGQSDYPITISEELYKYIERNYKSLLDNEEIKCGNIRIPNNMYIWATMNSADQGVQPMDTAFKRRWDFEYIDIDTDEKDNNVKICLELDNKCVQVFQWNDLRHHINNYLELAGVPEDKQLGPFFIKNKTLKNKENFKEAFKYKVLMYLFEDAAQYCRERLFSKNVNVLSFAKMLKDFDINGVKIIADFSKYEEIKDGVSGSETDEQLVTSDENTLG